MHDHIKDMENAIAYKTKTLLPTSLRFIADLDEMIHMYKLCITDLDMKLS